MPVAADQTPVAQARPGGREILAAVVLAILGFAVTAGALHAAILATIHDPLRLHADVRSEKLAMLDQWHGKAFSAAFGTSHVHNGFDPRVFDTTLAGTPVATHTVNLAVEGGSQTEQYVLAQHFLNQLQAPAQVGAPPQPCLVILELSAGSNFTNDHLVHPRAINIYNWPTAELITHFVSPGMSATQHYGRIGYALLAMGMHYSNVGMLSNEIFAPPLNEETLHNQTMDDRRGELVLPYHASYLPKLYEYEARLPKQPVISPGHTIEGNALLVERLAAMSPVRHVSFVYVEMPRLDDLGVGSDFPDHLTVKGPAGPMDVPIVNLGRADRYPEMYDPHIWFDDSHFDGRGAQIATHILAEELKKWYAMHGGPPPCG